MRWVTLTFDLAFRSANSQSRPLYGDTVNYRASKVADAIRQNTITFRKNAK